MFIALDTAEGSAYQVKPGTLCCIASTRPLASPLLGVWPLHSEQIPELLAIACSHRFF
jgi:hypothetical protein